MVELGRQFATLTPPADAASDLRFSAAPVEEHPRHRVAVDRLGLPCLLIAVVDANVAGPPLVLEHIRMQQGVECRITEPDGLTEVRRFTIIRCTDDDPETREYFMRVGGTVLDAIGDEPSSERVSGTIERLVELFRALAAPPRKSVIGFWGELFVIAHSRNAPVLVQAWRAFPEERFDFALSVERLEVKTALGRVRRHHFSLEQLLPLSGVEALVASVLIERSGAGPSVSELIESIRTAVADDAAAVLHVDTVVALTLGAAWRHAMDERFDVEVARSALMFLEPRDIPKPEGALPPEVTEVRFVSDVSGCPPASAEAYLGRSGLLSAVLQRA
jgi:Putative  PD-(D/E)XK family member, (DUF4420)